MAFNFSVFQTKTAVQTGLFCSSFFVWCPMGIHLSLVQRKHTCLKLRGEISCFYLNKQTSQTAIIQSPLLLLFTSLS